VMKVEEVGLTRQLAFVVVELERTEEGRVLDARRDERSIYASS
jgi:hypothetical protein